MLRRCDTTMSASIDHRLAKLGADHFSTVRSGQNTDRVRGLLADQESVAPIQADKQ